MHPTMEDFEPAVGGEFRDLDRPDAAPFVLTDAAALPVYDYPGRQRDPFVLKFRAADPAPAQGSRRLGNAALGEVAIFLVPVERDGDAVLYEAVFT